MKIHSKYPEEQINWQVIGLNQYNDIIVKLKAKNRCYLHANNLLITKFTPGKWSLVKGRGNEEFLIINDNYNINGYRFKKLIADYDHKNTGTNALNQIKLEFNKRTNMTFKKAFDTAPIEILRCVPKQLYMSQNEPYTGIVSGVDFSSHYPAAISGLLPTARGMKKLTGTVKPTKEYPFAFYTKSGHMAIYKELDTHNWLLETQLKFEEKFRLHLDKDKVYDDRFNKLITPDQDETILMKASEYNLKPEYQHFYDLRKDDAEAKATLNQSIGCFHRKKYNRDKYAHLAAVAIARANQKMQDLIAKLNRADIIQVQVDGILYKGNKEFGIHDKYLGAPVQEITGKLCRWESVGRYMIDNGDGTFKVKCQGYNKMSDGRDIKESNKFSDMDLWIKAKKEQPNEEE